MIKGTTKIMVNREGVPRIQEELDGQIRVFSLDDWNAELERRIKSKSEVVEPTGNNTEDHDTKESSLIEEDSEEDEGTGKTLIEEDDDADSADRSL